MGQSSYVHLENCCIKHETDKAFLIVYDDAEYWVPRSQLADPDDLEVGANGVTVSVTEWWAFLNALDGDE